MACLPSCRSVAPRGSPCFSLCGCRFFCSLLRPSLDLLCNSQSVQGEDMAWARLLQQVLSSASRSLWSLPALPCHALVVTECTASSANIALAEKSHQVAADGFCIAAHGEHVALVLLSESSSLHHEIIKYCGVRFAGTLEILPNLIVRWLSKLCNCRESTPGGCSC